LKGSVPVETATLQIDEQAIGCALVHRVGLSFMQV
jgi:hypothetical protein